MTKSKAGYTIAVVLFGTIGWMIHFIDLPSDVVAMFRGLFGVLTILAYMVIRAHRPDWKTLRENRRWLCLSGISLGLNWAFLFSAYRATTVAIASLCNYMAPMFLIFLSPLLFHEHMTMKKMICALLAFAGIVMVSGVLSGSPADYQPRGIALGLAAAVCFVGIVVCNRHLGEVDALDKTMVQLALSAIVLFPFVLLANRGVTWSFNMRSMIVMIILGIVQTGIAYILYLGAMSTLPVESLAILGYIEPVVSVLCSVFLLHEAMTATGWIGAALIIGAAVVNESI